MMPREFWIWAAWRDKGGIPSERPKNIPASIPKSWWARYLIHRGVRVIPKPAPSYGPEQYVLFASNDPLAALYAPTKYAVALSADPYYRPVATSAVVQTLRTKGHRVYSWCDCDATPASEAIAMKNRLGLDAWIGQAENSIQATHAWAYGAPIVVGQLAALSLMQKADILDGSVLWIEEHYWNKMPWVQRDYQGLPVKAGCIGIFHEAGATFRTISDYKAAGRLVAGDGLFNVESVTDWKELP